VTCPGAPTYVSSTLSVAAGQAFVESARCRHHELTVDLSERDRVQVGFAVLEHRIFQVTPAISAAHGRVIDQRNSQINRWQRAATMDA